MGFSELNGGWGGRRVEPGPQAGDQGPRKRNAGGKEAHAGQVQRWAESPDLTGDFPEAPHPCKALAHPSLRPKGHGNTLIDFTRMYGGAGRRGAS